MSNFRWSGLVDRSLDSPCRPALSTRLPGSIGQGQRSADRFHQLRIVKLRTLEYDSREPGIACLNSNGMLTSTGSPLFPTLSSASGHTQAITSRRPRRVHAGHLGEPVEPLPNSSFSTPLPSSFGAATVSASAAVALPNYGADVNQKSGISLDSGTFVQSATSLTANAAASVSHLHADFTISALLTWRQPVRSSVPAAF